jgi:4-amino-4-deoxy-L-arabinose transferase-like glycosyltransferase
LKRTPGYPLLVAACLALFGESLHPLGLVQHALGLVTAALAYLLARRLAGVSAGLLAGLLTAVAGNLLLLERQVMSETLFTTLLVAGITALVLGSQPFHWRWLFAAGLALGAATLVRPVAQALLLVAPLSLLLAPAADLKRSACWRQLLLGCLLVGIGYACLLVPWTVRGALAGEGPSVGALGQTLIGRTARHDRREVQTDRGFVYYDEALHATDLDETRLAARKMLQQAAERGSSGRAVHTRLRRELGLSEAEADRLMRDLAVEAILQRPVYYLTGTAQRFLRLWVAPPERLSSVWNDQSTIRREWEHAPSAALLEQPSEQIEQNLPTSQALIGLFQPAHLGPLYPALFLLGLVAAMVDRRLRLALVPAAVAILLIALSVALVGGVARYRYPEDPLIFAVIAVGLTAVARQIGRRLEGRAQAADSGRRLLGHAK